MMKWYKLLSSVLDELLNKDTKTELFANLKWQSKLSDSHGEWQRGTGIISASVSINGTSRLVYRNRPCYMVSISQS